jgi:hypothetical protein
MGGKLTIDVDDGGRGRPTWLNAAGEEVGRTAVGEVREGDSVEGRAGEVSLVGGMLPLIA